MILLGSALSFKCRVFSFTFFRICEPNVKFEMDISQCDSLDIWPYVYMSGHWSIIIRLLHDPSKTNRRHATGHPLSPYLYRTVLYCTVPVSRPNGVTDKLVLTKCCLTLRTKLKSTSQHFHHEETSSLFLLKCTSEGTNGDTKVGYPHMLESCGDGAQSSSDFVSR
jgi:hypothetical protein